MEEPQRKQAEASLDRLLGSLITNSSQHSHLPDSHSLRSQFLHNERTDQWFVRLYDTATSRNNATMESASVGLNAVLEHPMIGLEAHCDDGIILVALPKERSEVFIPTIDLDIAPHQEQFDTAIKAHLNKERENEMPTEKTYKDAFSQLRDAKGLIPANLQIAVDVKSNSQISISFTPTIPSGPKMKDVVDARVAEFGAAIDIVFADAPPHHIKKSGVTTEGSTITFSGRGVDLLNERVGNSEAMDDLAEAIKQAKSAERIR